MISYRLGPTTQSGLDSCLDRWHPAHLWLEAPCHTVLYKKVRADRLMRFTVSRQPPPTNPKPDLSRGATSDGKHEPPPLHCTTFFTVSHHCFTQSAPTIVARAQIYIDKPTMASRSSTAPAPASSDGLHLTISSAPLDLPLFIPKECCTH